MMLELLKRYWRHICRFFHKDNDKHSVESAALDYSDKDKDYFNSARSWSDDRFYMLLSSRYRYRCLTVVLAVVMVILLVVILLLIPTQHLEPLIIHHYQDGRVSVEKVKKGSVVTNHAQLENDLVRYVVNRESYDPMAYEAQYRLILSMSDRSVSQSYVDDQRSTNVSSLIHQLGNQRYRTVLIDNIIVLDQDVHGKTDHEVHHNLAEVHAVLIDHSLDTAVKRSQAVSIILSWNYSAPSLDPDVRWRNWDGFQVTHYQVKQRNWTEKGA